MYISLRTVRIALILVIALIVTSALSANHRPPKPLVLCYPEAPTGYLLVGARYSYGKGGNLLICEYDLDTKFMMGEDTRR